MKTSYCPFCNKPLLIGYIKTGGEVITWSPNKKRKSIFSSRWKVEDNDIKLGTFRFFKDGGRVKAYRCEHCKKIIIDEEDLN
ncbi:hypothetical protein H6A03_07330 [[Clostridium] spiroforme]|nr:hypothetical protein [Thomasclavelia spiroformis]MBM6879539.1 hypothetical protein [Thomasclavelia spiroformis]